MPVTYKSDVLPVTHEFGCFLHINDLALYQATVHYFKTAVKDKYNHYVQLADKKFKFWSKPGGFLYPGTDNLAFEYALHWDSEEKASKCHILVKGFFGPGTKTKNGKSYSNPWKGTQIEIQSSYIELAELLRMYHDFLRVIGAERFHDAVDEENSYIFQCARHLRYHERHEPNVIRLLKAIKEESATRGDYDLTEKTRCSYFDIYKLSVPSFDACGIETDYCHEVKSYRIKNFLVRDVSDPLRHPKLEVFLNNPEQKRIRSVSVKEYDRLIYDLDRLLSRLTHLLPQELTYVKDSYFDPGRRYTPRWSFPEWDYTNLPGRPEIELPGRNNELSFLSAVAFHPSGLRSMSEIIEETHLSEATCYRYLKKFKADGILDSIRSTVTQVYFKSHWVWKGVKDSLLTLSQHLDFGYKEYYGYVCKQEDTIRPYQERHKNVTPLNQVDDSVIVVESEKDYQRLKKELDKLGIKRKIVISPRVSIPPSFSSPDKIRWLHGVA